MKGKIGDFQRLIHIWNQLPKSRNILQNVSLEEFLKNSMMRFASIKQIEIIGEAANYISEDTKNKFTDIQWRQIIGMRHILVHEYFGIDSQLIWQIIVDDLPKLKIAIQTVISAGSN